MPGSSELDAGSAAGREMAGLATEGSDSGPAQQTLGAATREQSAFLKGNSTESMQRAEATAAKSENPAVRQFAEVAASDSLTGKTIGLFTPNAENRENRAAFEQAYGVTLPDTAGATRRMLREIAAQQNVKSEAAPAVQSAELPSEAASVPQTVQDAPAETADAMPETAAPDNVREATVAVGETDSYENAPLRETLGLRPEAPKTQREAEVQRALEGWRVTDKAAETISKNMPDRVDADRYAAAASPLYRLGRSGADTFAQALELAGSMSGTAEDINYILSTDAGRTALEIAYTQGKGERMLYAEKMAGLGGTLGSESTSGRGEVYAKGTMRQESDVADQIIRLNAAATGTDAILYNVLQNDRSIRAYVDTETARIFFGDNAQDIFGTVLHEDYHWYNALDAEGARTLQEHALEYLAKSSGYESLDEMVRAKLEDYSAQSLTYEQAAEELVADAWRGIFDSEESFKRWVTFQRGQAEKNAGKSGAIHKVMEQVRQMLDGLISRAKEVLTIDPDNRAALKAKRLAETEKRTLQDEYFAHAEKAMDNLRTAKENAAALKTESAAGKQGVRFSILKDKTGESYIKIDEDILKDVPQEEWKSTVKQAIKERFPNGFERNGWTILNHKDGRNEFVWSKSTKALQWENAEAYADKMRMAANLDEIIRTADEVYREPANHKNAEAFNRGKIKIQVGQNVYEADVLTAIKTDQREIFYDIVDIKPIKIETSGKAHIESEDSRSSGPEVSVEASGGTHVESEDSRSRLPEASKQSIAQTSDESKRTDEPVKKTVRFQLSESRRNQGELQKESRELERQRRALKEERANWQESNEVRAIEEKKKAYGLFSEKGKAFRASEEYQSYLEKRKEFNRRGAELESRIGEVNDKLRQAQAEVENARQAVKQEQQKVYDTKAKAAGGKPEYRRKLAVEQFGTTDRFERAGYILPDGRMLNFAQNDGTRDTDHREILDAFGPAEVSNGTEALNEFLADGNVRVMAEAPGVDIAAKTPPTEQQLRQIRAMVEQLGSEKRRFTLDISTTDGRVAASKEYSGKVDADKVVREIREYYKTGELPAESELARFRYQRAEQADREAKQNQQRQASRVLAEKAAAFDTLNQFFGLTKNTRLSDAALESLAIRWTKTNGSRADRTKLANETRALVEYLRSEGADMAKAQGLAETLAGEVLDEATYRNTELWNQYPDLHDLTYTVDKNGKAKAELVKRYGSWTEAVAEARRHGVKLRQAEGYRDGNPAEQYEAIVNDTRAVGGVKESAAALFRSAAQEAGVAGAASMESTEWLDVLMNVHDTIKPKMMSRFADVAEYEDAKVELAGRMIGDIMSHPEMTDAEAVFEGILKHNREVAAMAAGSEERAAEGLFKGAREERQAHFAGRVPERGEAEPAGHGGLCGPCGPHPGRAAGAEQHRGDGRGHRCAEGQDHRREVGKGDGELHQRPADRPADHAAQARQHHEPGAGQDAGQLRRSHPDREPGRGHRAGSQPAHGGRCAGSRHHGGGTALREEFLGQAAGRGGSRDTPARRRPAAISPARHQAGRDELHRRAQKPCGQSVGSHACCDRLDHRHGRDHGGRAVGGLKAVCGAPRSGVRRGCRGEGQRSLLGSREQDVPAGHRGDPAQLHHHAAGGHPAQRQRVCKDADHVYHPALPELRHPGRRRGRLQGPEGAVRCRPERREQGRGTAGWAEPAPGGGKPGGADGGICPDEDRRRLLAPPVGQGAGRERRRYGEKPGQTVLRPVH